MRKLIVILVMGAWIWACGNQKESGETHGVPNGQAIYKKYCNLCHGVDGNSVDPQYPRLAGQYNLYLQHVLHEYKSGQRNNPIMKGMVATLSDQDIKDIAAYFSSLPGKMDTLKGHIGGDN